MFTHSTQIRVRYGETDQMGYVYYGNYALYYEVGRVEALRSLGLTYRKLEEDGIAMPVVRVDAKYVGPAKYDDLLVIKTIIKELPSRFIDFHVLLTNPSNQIIHKAQVTLCFRNLLQNKAVRAPALLIDCLKPYFTD